METLNKTLKKLRESQGFSQSEVASFIGVSRQTYIKYENGEIDPPLRVVALLRRLFKTSYDSLLEGFAVASEPCEKPNAPVSAFETKVNSLPLDMKKIVMDLVDSLTTIAQAKDNESHHSYRSPGGLTGKFWMADDFDETPDGFEDL